MTKLLEKTTLIALSGATLMLLSACSSTSRFAAVPGAVRGQDIQPGQQEDVPMTREEAEAEINAANENQVGQNIEVPGKPDVAAEQGALPPGVGYSNNPGELYDPAMGQHTYVHHYIHHIYHGGSPAEAEANTNTPPPSGYRRGAYVVPDNEDPNSRGGGGGGFGGAYNLPIQHTYNGPVTHNNYGTNIAGGGYGADPQGSGVPGGFFAGDGGGGATTWGTFGEWHPDAFDGAGSIGGFTD